MSLQVLSSIEIGLSYQF